MLTLALGATAALASAAPVSPTHFEVTYSETGQMTVDVYGSSYDPFTPGSTGDFFVAGQGWNPVVFGQPSGYGQFDGASQFDTFVRYQYSSPTGNFDYLWDTPQTQDPSTPPTVPEPGSMLLLGSGLLTLAGIARRRYARPAA